MPGPVLPLAMNRRCAEKIGISVSRIRNEITQGRWCRYGSTVIVTDPRVDQHLIAAAAGLVLAGPGSALSGWSALEHRGVHRPGSTPDSTLVLTRGGKNRQVGDVHIRPTHRPYTMRLVSIDDRFLPLAPVVDPARAVSDAVLGARFQPSVTATVATILQRRLCTFDDLVRELDDGPRNGSGMLRRALAEIGGAESVAEVDAARALVRGGVPEFEQNVRIIERRTGRLLGRTDVLWRTLRACLEIDSWKFHYDAPDWNATLGRHTILTRRGLATLHYAPSAVRIAPRTFAADVGEWLRDRSVELALPLPPRARRLPERRDAPPLYV